MAFPLPCMGTGLANTGEDIAEGEHFGVICGVFGGGQGGGDMSWLDIAFESETMPGNESGRSTLMLLLLLACICWAFFWVDF